MSEKVLLDASLEASDDSEDEDYNPEAAVKSNQPGKAGSDASDNDDDDDKLGEYDSGDEKTIGSTISSIKKRKREVKEEPGTEGGLVKTRSQRAQEIQDVKTAPVAASSSATSTSQVDALWAAMNANTAPSTKTQTSETTTNDNKSQQNDPATIQISRTYEFAGEVHTENKTVLKDSQEARDYLDSLTSQVTPAPPPPKMYNGKPLRKVMKRKSMLEESAKPKKINTLEKSRMEWSGFVDSEGIDDELKRANKNGYLDKQDFLNKSEHARYGQWKSGQKQP